MQILELELAREAMSHIACTRTEELAGWLIYQNYF
jgi:hypothetical protein